MNTQFLTSAQKYTIGIYGGVGPLAHIEFEKLLLSENKKRGAQSDQDHPVWIALNASSTPDRTQGLLYGKQTAENHLLNFSKVIEQAGADCLFVICNTAHGYYESVQKDLSIPWIHLMQITASAITEQYPNITHVGVLGTDATVELGLYHNALEKHHLKPIAPNVGSDIQKKVMDAIYDPEFGVKATGSLVDPHAVQNLVSAAEWCREQGAEIVIAACTEISVALTPETYANIPIIDPLTIAANTALDIAFGLKTPDDFR